METADAPGSLDYGILEREASDDPVSFHAGRIRVAGYSVVQSRFTDREIAELGSRLDRVLQQQVEEFGGESRMAAIDDAWTVRCPLAHDDGFLALVTDVLLLEMCRRLLGDYIVLMQQNGVINPPRQAQKQTAYHRDLPYQHFTSSRPLAVSALFCIDPFLAESGATTVLPGSHHVESFPAADVAASLDTTVEAPAGSFIVFDSMLFHRAGANRSERPRRAVNQVFSIPLIAQQISIPDALRGRHADDPMLARLLGYESAPARSALAWRERRLLRQSAAGQ
jgi:ectoine hydroxylase-related dioxygenase (phytanoyl-CoA dioxygenase family)